jgi:O-antigen ligase
MNPSMKSIQELKILNRLNDLLVILFFISFVFDIRPLVGLSSILLTANALLVHKLETGKYWNPFFFNLFTAGLFLYFAIQGIAILHTRNLEAGLAIFQTNLSMIVLPVAASYSSLINKYSFVRFMRGYIYIVFAATLLALIYALVTFFQHHDSSVFFYHSLVRIYSNHAIQFSVIVFIGILFLIEDYSQTFLLKNKRLTLFAIIYFTCFLFLLSSKLVIIIYFLYFLFILTFTGIFIGNRHYRLAGISMFLALMLMVFLVNTPFRKRILDETGARISLIRQDRFTPGDYFTGVQFRILSWRFVYEILNEKHAWMLGVNPGDAQDLLNEKYTNENMFVGGAPENKTGYLGYHSHDQFLQAILESGIFGLAFFVMSCIGLIRLAGRAACRPLYALVLLLLCNCFTDAPLKTQYGIILFVFFPLFIYQGEKQGIPGS